LTVVIQNDNIINVIQSKYNKIKGGSNVSVCTFRLLSFQETRLKKISEYYGQSKSEVLRMLIHKEYSNIKKEEKIKCC